jgi:hypothetical protein
MSLEGSFVFDASAHVRIPLAVVSSSRSLQSTWAAHCLVPPIAARRILALRTKTVRNGPALGREEQSMIEAHQLTKRYGEKTAVDRLDAVVRPGAVTGFLGPNARASSPRCDQAFFANKIIYWYCWQIRVCT